METLKCDHTSVGLMVWKNNRLLLIERRKPPYGVAPPAGHVDDHGSYEDAARSELEEEVGLEPTELRLLAEGRKENCCRRPNGNWHYWKIYEVTAKGTVKLCSTEARSSGWYSIPELIELCQRTKLYLAGEVSEFEWQERPGMEPVWCNWLAELGVLGPPSFSVE